MATDGKYLDEAVNRALELCKRVMRSDIAVAAKTAQKYLLPLPSVYPFWVAYPGGFTIPDDAGDDYDDQQYTIVLRYIAGSINDNFDGVLLGKLWLYQVAVINMFRQHRSLTYAKNQQDIPELADWMTRISSVSRFGVFRDDVQRLGMEFQLELRFHVEDEEEEF